MAFLAGVKTPFAVAALGVLFGFLLVLPDLGAIPDRFPQRRKVVVGADYEYPPYSFLDQDRQPSGQDVEIIKRIAELANLELEFKFSPWKEVLQDLQEGRVDLVLSILYTTERSTAFAYSIPYSADHYSIFVPRDSNIQGVEDLQNRSMIILNGDAVYDEIVKPLGLQGPTIFTQSTPEALMRLSRREADYSIVSYSTGIEIIQASEQPGKETIKHLKVVGHPVLPILYRFGFRKEDTELLTVINENLDHLKSKGELAKINARWVHHRDVGLTRPEILRLALYILSPLLLLISLLFLWSRTLRREVRRKSQHLRAARNQAVLANEAKTKFLAYMGHEIRSPLNSLLGFTQILLRESKPLQLSQRVTGHLKNIELCSENLTSLINNLLDLSKIEVLSS